MFGGFPFPPGGFVRDDAHDPLPPPQSRSGRAPFRLQLSNLLPEGEQPLSEAEKLHVLNGPLSELIALFREGVTRGRPSSPVVTDTAIKLLQTYVFDERARKLRRRQEGSSRLLCKLLRDPFMIRASKIMCFHYILGYHVHHDGCLELDVAAKRSDLLSPTIVRPVVSAKLQKQLETFPRHDFVFTKARFVLNVDLGCDALVLQSTGAGNFLVVDDDEAFDLDRDRHRASVPTLRELAARATAQALCADMYDEASRPVVADTLFLPFLPETAEQAAQVKREYAVWRASLHEN